jgi:hypothetical protein
MGVQLRWRCSGGLEVDWTRIIRFGGRRDRWTDSEVTKLYLALIPNASCRKNLLMLYAKYVRSGGYES